MDYETFFKHYMEFEAKAKRVAEEAMPYYCEGFYWLRWFVDTISFEASEVVIRFWSSGREEYERDLEETVRFHVILLDASQETLRKHFLNEIHGEAIRAYNHFCRVRKEREEQVRQKELRDFEALKKKLGL